MQLSGFNLSDCFSAIPRCGEVFDTWNDRPSLATNEGMSMSTMLLAEPTGNTMLATSSLFALDLFAIREMGRESPDQVVNLVVVDRSQRVEHFWQEVAKTIRASQCRNEAIEKIQSLVDNHKAVYFSGSMTSSPKAQCQRTIKAFQDEIARGVSWLAEDSRFLKVKKLFEQNRFAFLRLDFCDRQAMQSLAKTLATHKLTLDTIYLSNAYEYTIISEPIKTVSKQKEQQNSFRAGMAVLISPKTYVVDTEPRLCYACDMLSQRTRIRGTLPIMQFFEELPHQATALKCGHSVQHLFPLG